jgi:Transglutaminase-like superfamily
MATLTILTAKQSKTANGSEYCLAPDAAVIVMPDGSARVLDMADRIYAVPPVGAMMLRETLQHGPILAAEAVAAAYGAPLPRVEADLRQFLTPLEQRGILLRGASRRPRGALAAGLMVRLVKSMLGALPSLKARAGALLTLARLSFRLFGWTGTVAAWRRCFPLRAGSAEVEARAGAIDDAVCAAAAGNLFGVACKERALTCWALARSEGLPASLVIGIELYPIAGHCWCEIGSRIVSDHPENCARYTPALRYE